MKVMRYLRRVFAVPVYLLVISFFWGCGGSDGSGANGILQQAVVNENNAYPIIVGAYNNGGEFSGIVAQNITGTYGVVQSEGIQATTYPLGLYLSDFFENILHRLTLTSNGTASYKSFGGSSAVVLEGYCGGNLTYNASNIDASSGTFSGSFVMTEYCDQDIEFNGNLSVSGTIDANTKELIDYNIVMNNFSLSGAQQSLTINGEANATLASYPINATFSYSLKDNSTGKVYDLSNLAIERYDEIDFIDVFMSGRYEDPDYGYISLRTVEPLRYWDYEFWPSSGMLVAYGSKGAEGGPTKSVMFVLNETAFKVFADTAGDGRFDYESDVISWSQQ